MNTDIDGATVTVTTTTIMTATDSDIYSDLNYSD